MVSQVPAPPTAKYHETFSHWSICQCLHDHPTAVKVAQVAGVLLGGMALVAIPFALPVLGVSITASIGAVGGISLLVTLVSWIFLRYLTCAKHDMKDHVYTPMEYREGDQILSRLYYRGDIPVLEMDGTSEQCGRAHGYLLGPQICELVKNLGLAIHGVMRLPRAPHLQNVLMAVRQKIPTEFAQELQGFVDGYNNWAREIGETTLTFDDALLMHLIADSKHFHPKEQEREWQQGWDESPAESVACTSLLGRDENGHVLFGRNMDWCPFGKGGSYSLVFVWKKDGVAALGIPGLIGVITGWNRHKLALAINVCPGTTQGVRGIPAILYNRHILKQAATVEGAKQLIQQNRPLGAYHMTLADANAGACISFYQGVNGVDYIRDLSQDNLHVLNWEYPKCEGGYFNSSARQCLLTKYFRGAPDGARRKDLMANALQLSPLVNSWITMHSLFFQPATDEVQMSWDNGFAASQEPAKIRMTDVFDEPIPAS